MGGNVVQMERLGIGISDLGFREKKKRQTFRFANIIVGQGFSLALIRYRKITKNIIVHPCDSVFSVVKFSLSGVVQ